MVQSVDFERVLGTLSCARSVHFSVHFLACLPSQKKTFYFAQEISKIWLGVVVPKRYAKRAVTRNLVKRQVREAVICRSSLSGVQGLKKGLWVLRLKAPFNLEVYPCASSVALRRCVAEELDVLLNKAMLSLL
jgi:ribonuclease P protein component